MNPRSRNRSWRPPWPRVAASTHLTAQQRAMPRPVKPAYDDGIVEALAIKGNVHLVAGSGANITVQVAPEGLLIVDSSVAAMSEKVLAAIRTFSDKPVRHIINTSGDEHHTGGNEKPVGCPAATSTPASADRAAASPAAWTARR